MPLASHQLVDHFGSQLLLGEPFAGYTSSKTGGAVQYILIIDKVEDLILAIQLANNTQIKYRVLGRAGRVLVGPGGWQGLLIINQTQQIVPIADKTQLLVDAGVGLDQLTTTAASLDMGGLEALAGRERSVGGELYHNPDRFGFQIGSLARELICVTPGTSEPSIRRYHNHSFEFAPYLSLIKKYNYDTASSPKMSLLVVRFQLQRSRRETILVRLAAYRQKLSAPKHGSWGYLPDIFLPNHDRPNENQLIKLLTEQKVERFRVGQAYFSPHQPNAILTRKGATSQDVRALIELTQTTIRGKTGIELATAVEYLGTW